MYLWMTSILLLLCLSIFLGVKWRINIGPITMAIALLYGCIGLDLELTTVLSSVPVRLLFYIVSVTLFYGIAQENGTLGSLAAHIMYSMRLVPRFVPLVIFLLTAVIAYMGVGIFAGAFLAPLAFQVGRQARIQPLLIYCCVNCGAIWGSNMPQSLGGIVIHGLISQGPYELQAQEYTSMGSALTTVVCVLMVAAAHGLYRGNGRPHSGAFCKPPPLSRAQRINLALIALVSFLMLAGSTLSKLLPGAWAHRVTTLTDIGVLCTLATLVAILLRLGNEREVLKNYIPWCTITLLTGMSVLLSVIGRAGATMELPIHLLSAFPPITVAPLLTLVAGAMSLFTSGVSVVCPSLFPLVPIFAAATGVSPGLLYAGIFAGASVTGTSPFSTAGSIVLSNYGTIPEQNELFYKIFPIPVFLLLATMLCTAVWYVLI